MLRFFFTRHLLPTLQTPFSSPFKLESAAPFINKPLPMSHLYVTSNHYVDYIKVALGNEHQHKLEELDSNQQKKLTEHSTFPVSFQNRSFKSIRELHDAVTQVVGNANEINLVIINGLGNGLGDNYIGLGALQRLTNLLAPRQVNFHLMQELDQRIAPVYEHQSNVTMHCNVMSIEKFMKMDFYIDFDSIDNMLDIDSIAAAHVNAHAFSINHLVPKTNLQALITVDPKKAKRMRNVIADRLDRNRQTVLLHPLASTPLRTLPNKNAAEIVRALIDQGFNVASLFPHDNPPKGFADLSDHCNSIDDLIHIVHEIDAVISVGTVIYHLAAALSKPTILLPTVLADIRSAELLPEVTTWLPTKSQALIQNLHTSKAPEHLDKAKKIWLNLEPKDLAKATKRQLASFIMSESGELRSPTSPKRISVILVNMGDLTQLTPCLDTLLTFSDFDPIRLYTVQLNDYFSVNLHDNIKQALNDGCDFIWFLNSNANIEADYLPIALAQLQKNKNIESHLVRDCPSTLQNNALLGTDNTSHIESNNNKTIAAWASFSSKVISAYSINTLIN